MSVNELESNQAVKKREVELARQRMIDRAIRDFRDYGVNLGEAYKTEPKYEGSNTCMSCGDVVTVAHSFGNSYEGIIEDYAEFDDKVTAVKIRDMQWCEHWEYPGSILLISQPKSNDDVLNGDAYCPFTNGRCNGMCVFQSNLDNTCNLACASNLLIDMLLDESKRRHIDL